MSQAERPPTPSGDWSSWGERLNEFLMRNRSRLLPYRSDGSAKGQGELVYDREGYMRVSDGTAFRIVPIFVNAPSTASSSGYAGQMAYDTSYLYICTATNTWRRIAHATW